MIGRSFARQEQDRCAAASSSPPSPSSPEKSAPDVCSGCGPLDAGAPGLDAGTGTGGLDAAAVGLDASAPAAPDAAAVAGLDASTPPDAAALPQLTEQEPNNYGTGGTEYNAATPPFQMTGFFETGTHPDVDVLGAQLNAGDVWAWDLAGTTDKVSPYLYIFEKANVVPYMVSFAAPSATAEQEHFVLESGFWYVVVADHNNPRDSSSTCGASNPCVGGPDYTWVLTVRATPRAPTPVAFPSSVQASLRHAQAIDLYGFHAATTFKFDVDLKAKRKSPPSTLESRMSLFDATSKLLARANGGSSRNLGPRPRAAG